LIDGTGAPPDSGVVVYIRNGLIQDIGQSFEHELPENDKTIDLKGATILPGFFNTHIHSGYKNGNLMAWARDGVTTVRDLSNLGRYSPQESYFRRNLLNKKAYHARLVAAGPIVTTTGGYGNFYVTSVKDARHKINDLIDAGTDLIKIAIVHGNPLEDLGALTEVQMVIHNGVIIRDTLTQEGSSGR